MGLVSTGAFKPLWPLDVPLVLAVKYSHQDDTVPVMLHPHLVCFFGGGHSQSIVSCVRMDWVGREATGQNTVTGTDGLYLNFSFSHSFLAL